MIKLGANILSQNVQRNLARSTSDLSISSERLASGQRINRASDDAAGLAISMSLDKDHVLAQTARRNVSDGISVVSIISSGLRSQKGILLRMAELAEQSANGTYSSQQRKALQREYSALIDEFDRVADTTEFNGIKLLRNSSPQTMQFMAGITGADSSLIQVNAANSHRYAGTYILNGDYNNNSTYSLGEFNQHRVYLYDSFAENPTSEQIAELAGVNSAGVLFLRDSTGSDITLRFALDYGAFGATSNQSRRVMIQADRADGEILYDNTIVVAGGFTKLDLQYTFASSGATFSFGVDMSSFTSEPRLVGSTSQQQTAIGFTNILNKLQSRKALDTVMNRIDSVSALEGQFGAVEARLEVTHSLLSASGENFAAASSRIKDADLAAESANNIRNRILQQTATSLLGQANLAPQLALRLLQG